MKILTCTILCLTTLAATPGFGQDMGQPASQRSSASLTKFDIDFPGGTPNDLVIAIEKSMERPLNAILPDEYTKGVQLPSFKMKGVDIMALFQALRKASTTQRVTTPGSYYNTSFGFVSQAATISDHSIWVFFNDLPQDVKISRFFLLTPYLDRGLTVDDITTAIQAAWKMLGGSPTPALSFHKETKLLIAVGSSVQIATIEQALKALNPQTPSTMTKSDPLKTER